VRQFGQNLLDYPFREMSLLWIAADVAERQYGDRRLANGIAEAFCRGGPIDKQPITAAGNGNDPPFAENLAQQGNRDLQVVFFN